MAFEIGCVATDATLYFLVCFVVFAFFDVAFEWKFGIGRYYVVIFLLPSNRGKGQQKDDESDYYGSAQLKLIINIMKLSITLLLVDVYLVRHTVVDQCDAGWGGRVGLFAATIVDVVWRLAVAVGE